jgi:hypothetical protein
LKNKKKKIIMQTEEIERVRELGLTVSRKVEEQQLIDDKWVHALHSISKLQSSYHRYNKNIYICTSIL